MNKLREAVVVVLAKAIHSHLDLAAQRQYFENWQSLLSTSSEFVLSIVTTNIVINVTETKMNISIAQAKTKFSRVIRKAESGELETITHHGKPVVTLHAGNIATVCQN